MRKFLLSILFFVFACASVWGDVDYSISGSTLTFTYSGSGSSVLEAVESGSKWNTMEFRGSITTLVINEGVTSIAADAFKGFSVLQSVTVPSTLTSIGSKAFMNCSKTNAIHAYSPNTWASITFTDQWSSPFGTTKDALVTSRDFYFYGNNTIASYLAFTAGLTSISQYAFYNATSIRYVYIPGTVTSIGQHALNCNIEQLTVNKDIAPSTGTTAITWTTSSDTYLFLRENATNSYDATPWYYSSSKSSSGAYYLGNKGGDDSSIKTTCSWKNTRYVYKVSGEVGSISWDITEDGIFTLEGTGNISTTFTSTNSDSNVLPWYRFRFLINKVVIKGGVTGLSNALSWARGLDEIDINQNAIPTSTTSEGNINNNFNIRDNIVVKIKAASLIDESASNLGVDPWDISKLDIQLSDNLEISDDDDYTNLIDSCKKYVEKPITLQLGRTLIVDGDQYNTFCSPIDLTKAQLNNADIRALESSSLDGEDLTLTFSASSLDAIEAGKPYLVRPTTETLSNPIFENIDPSSLVSTATNTVTEYVDFIGVLAPTPLTEGNKNTLFLGAGNELFWPEANGNIGGMRAYFSIKGAAQKNGIKARIVMNKEVATGIEDVRSESAGAVRSEKILRNGQIIIIRDGKEYNVMGIIMKMME